MFNGIIESNEINNDGVIDKPNWTLVRNQKAKDISNSELKDWMDEQFRNLAIVVEDCSYEIKQSVEAMSSEIESLQILLSGHYSAVNKEKGNLQSKDKLLDLYRILARQNGLCGYGEDDATPFGDDGFCGMPSDDKEEG